MSCLNFLSSFGASIPHSCVRWGLYTSAFFKRSLTFYSDCLRRLNTEGMKSRVCIPSMGKMKKFCPATNSLPFTACGANMESGSVNGGTSDPGVACAPSSRFLSALSARRFDGMSGPRAVQGVPVGTAHHLSMMSRMRSPSEGLGAGARRTPSPRRTRTPAVTRIQAPSSSSCRCRCRTPPSSA